MHARSLTAYEAMPEPRRVAALGDCALGCGILGTASETVGQGRGRAPRRPSNPRLPADAREIAAALIDLIDAD